MNFKEYLRECLNEAKINPEDMVSVVGRGRGQMDVTQYIRKAAKLNPKKDTQDDVYFDGMSLVYGSKTVAADALKDETLTVQDLVNLVMKAKGK